MKFRSIRVSPESTLFIKVIERSSDKNAIQRVKHCVNFSGSKPRTPLIIFSCILSNSEKIWQICLDLLVGICNNYLYEFYLHT